MDDGVVWLRTEPQRVLDANLLLGAVVDKQCYHLIRYY